MTMMILKEKIVDPVLQRFYQFVHLQRDVHCCTHSITGMFFGSGKWRALIDTGREVPAIKRPFFNVNATNPLEWHGRSRYYRYSLLAVVASSVQ